MEKYIQILPGNLSSKYKRILFAVFIAALLYGTAVLSLRNYYENRSGVQKSDWNVAELKGDARNFFDRAVSLSSFRAYDNGVVPKVAYYRPPGYPIVMSLLFMVFGSSLKAVILLQILLSALIVVIVADTGRMLFDENTGTLTGILTILYYPLWNASVTINSELISMFYWAASMYFMFLFVKSEDKKKSRLILSGLLSGMAALTRGQFLVIAPVSLFLVYWSEVLSGKDKFIAASRWFAFFLVPVVLWAVYAYAVSGLFVVVSTQGMYSLWWGWSPAVVVEELYPVWNNDWSQIAVPPDQIGVLVSTKSAGWFLSEVAGFIMRYPRESSLIGLFKLMEAWGIEYYNGHSFAGNTIRFIKINWDLILTIPALIILIRTKQQSVFLKFLLVISVVYTVLSVLTAALYRYRFPSLDMFFLVLSSFTIIYFFGYLRKRKLDKPLR